MNSLKEYFRKGDPYVLLSSLGLILSLVMVVFFVGIILVKGLSIFWPSDVELVQLKDGTKYLGELWSSEENKITNPDHSINVVPKVQYKTGNRDIYGFDFKRIDKSEIESISNPADATVFERKEYGNFYGFIKKVAFKGKEYTKNNELFDKATEALDYSENLVEKQADLMKSGNPDAEDKIEKLNAEISSIQILIESADGSLNTFSLSKFVGFYQPNQMNLFEKSIHYLLNIWTFISGEPRESNTEGGVFPAIFGTVMMVILMSVLVVPFGVLAAVYLNEYAKQGLLTRIIRLSVNNLAGVPSIVYGIFGLGFFIYMIGGSIDTFFFSEKLPEPTYGTGGILWASLTLALLTLPVVVVATEEGILAVPKANKEGALALGATKWQMIRKIVLPNATPGILTGLILAISRGAGEVAPLMITGVVKLAPAMPLDSVFPYFHLDRKFMHLGFHIYDVGFQSPNVEAAVPMVYSTALLLIIIVVFLNLLAIFLRNKMRKKYKSASF